MKMSFPAVSLSGQHLRAAFIAVAVCGCLSACDQGSPVVWGKSVSATSIPAGTPDSAFLPAGFYVAQMDADKDLGSYFVCGDVAGQSAGGIDLSTPCSVADIKSAGFDLNNFYYFGTGEEADAALDSLRETAFAGQDALRVVLGGTTLALTAGAVGLQVKDLIESQQAVASAVNATQALTSVPAQSVVGNRPKMPSVPAMPSLPGL